MDFKQILLPLITESRRKFGDNSLLLVVDSVGISYQEIDPELSRKPFPESAAGLNKLKLLTVLSGDYTVQGYIGEIRYWQTKLCQCVNEILINALKIENLNASLLLLLKSVRDVSMWKKKNEGTTELVTLLSLDFRSDEGQIVSDNEMLTVLEYSLRAHFETTFQIAVEEIEHVALPIAVSGQLWVAITGSKSAKTSIKLFDCDGFECGYATDIHFNIRFLQNTVGTFSLEEPMKYSAHEVDRKDVRRNDNNPNESYNNRKGIGSSRETDSLKLSVSESAAGTGIKSSTVIDEIRKAVEMIIGVPCNGDDRVSFISLGFDSLKLARLEFLLQKEFGEKISIPYGSAHQYPSIASLSERILESFGLESSSIPENMEATNFRLLTEKLTKIIRSNGEIPLSAAQKRLIFLYQLNTASKLKFVETLRFNIKNLKIRKFQKAFNRVVARHTALRTIYTIYGQTILSLTEAFYHIWVESEDVLESLGPIDLLGPSIPMRIFGTEQEEWKCIKELKESISDCIFEVENQCVLEGTQSLSMQFMNAKSSDLIVIQLHHIMIDGFSIKLMTDELRILYEKNQLRSSPYQYGHFVLQEDQQKQDSGTRKLREAFWQHQLHDVVLQTLPVDKIGLQMETFLGCRLQFKVDSRIRKCLQNLATECCVTEFSVLLANFQLLQYKRYGFKDSCIGITVGQRETPGLCTIVGCLLNVVPLISTIAADDQIHHVIKKCYQRLNESIQKQVQFDDLIATLRLKRDLSNSPLFQVLFILDNNNDPNDDVNDTNDRNFAQYDQVWYFQYHKEGMTVKIDYNGSHFYKSTVEAIAHQYFRLLRKMSQNAYVLAKDIKMTNSMEELIDYKLRIENRCDFPQKCTLLDLIHKQNSLNPYCNTVVQHEVQFSSIFLQRKSNQLSRFLTQSWLQFLGEEMRNDDFVLLIFDRSVFLLLTIFALWKCGIGVAPLNPETSSEQLEEILAKTSYPALIYGFNQEQLEIIPENSSGLVLKNSRKQKVIFAHDISRVITLISGYSDQEPRRKLSRNDLAYMTFTSGSTGMPKGICTEFYGLNNLAVNYAELLSIKSSSSIYQVVNPAFDIFFADVLEAQTNGATLCLARQRIPDLEEMSKITHAYIMPAYLSAIQSKQWKKLTNLEQINFGGDYIQHKTLQDAIRIGLRFHNQYGLTEHSIYSTCKLMKVCDKTSSVGKAFKNLHFFIRDSERNLLGQSITGICCTSGTGVSRGYWHANEYLNQLAFLPNRDLTQLELLLNYDTRYFYSGDLAKVMGSTLGELSFHGRSDFQVKIRGIQVDIPAIEAVLGKHHLVKECIVVCLRRTEIDEPLLIAYIIISHSGIIMQQEGKVQLVKKILSEYMLVNLPTFMIPTQYVFVQHFPLINGKIDRKQLPIPESFSKFLSKTDYVFEPKEKRVMEIFAALLPNKTTISLDDSFFEVGGDSLKALIAIQNIKQETKLDLSLRDIFLLPSFEAILKRLRDNCSTDHKEVQNLTKPKLAEFKSNSLQFYGNINLDNKLTSNQLPNITAPTTSNEFMDSFRTAVTERMSGKPEKINNKNRKSSRSWFNGTVPVSLQQERLLFLYSLGKEYREGYKLQFRITFDGYMNHKILNISLNLIVRKHQLLHTVFLQGAAGNTVQEIVSLTECYLEVHKNVPRNEGIRLELPELYNTPLLAVSVYGNLELMLILDHLIVDGRSIAILTNDLVEIYNELINGGSVSFEVIEKGSSYAEFCLKQRSEMEGLQIALKNSDCFVSLNRTMMKDKVEVQEVWKHVQEISLRLHDFPPLSFQGDLRNERPNRRSNTIRLKMPLDLSIVKHFCVTERCTLFAYLLGVFSLTVHSKQPDQKRFSLVTSALNRTTDTSHCVGLFVNTVIIPIDITTFESVSELFHKYQQNIAEALQFQHIPFDYIIRKLNPTRIATGTEAYQISFVLQNASTIKLPKINGVKTTITEEINSKYAKFDQAWCFTEFEDCIEMSVEYRIDMYSCTKIRRLMELFIQMALQVSSSRFVKVRDILESPLQSIKDKDNTVGQHGGIVEKNWALEEALLRIWKETLGIPRISVHDNFFGMGGHSLIISNLCYKIEQQINFQCPPQAIFKHQTIKELAEYISDRQSSKIIIGSKERLSIRACPLQESLVRMHYNMDTEEAMNSTAAAAAILPTTVPLPTDVIKAYQTGFSVSLKSINLTKLKYSLNMIIMRHCALRTTFYCEKNDFFQEIRSGTEVHFTPRKSSFEQATATIPNPFHGIPILCWLFEKSTDGTTYCELHLQVSHVVCDGKSLTIIARELSDNYLGEAQNSSVRAESFIQFSRRTEQRFRERHTEIETFWWQTLKDAENVNLYHEKSRRSTALKSNRCKFFCKKFKSLNNLIVQLAMKCCCSPFVIQLAAFSKALSGITMQTSRLLISFPIDMRDSEAQQCVGMCINVLPVLINVTLTNYRDLIQDITKSLADAYVNADISTEEMGKLCEQHGISNFADIMIVSNYEECSDNRYQILNDDNFEFTKCLLTLFLVQQQEDVVAKIECREDLLYEESIAVILNQWAKIICRMAKVIVTNNNEVKYEKDQKFTYISPFVAGNKDMWSEEKVLLSEREKCFMRGNGNEKISRKHDYPAFRSYQHLLQEAFLSNHLMASMTALIGNEESISYRTLTGLIHQTSKIIQEKVAQTTGSSLRPDSVIPVIARNSIRTWVACLAVIMAGAAYLPIDSTAPVKRILNILEQMRAKFYITVEEKRNNDDDEFEDAFNFSLQSAKRINLSDTGLDHHHHIELLKSQARLRNTSSDLAYVIFTSGTSGKPKGVAIGQNGLLNMSVACTRDFWMEPGDCVYQFTNFAFDNSVLEITMALINGGALFLREDFFTSRNFLDEMKHRKITHALLFPGLVNTFTDEEIAEMRHLKYWIVGAESLSEKVLECALKFGVNVIQNYGPTETTAYALTKRMKLLDKPNNIGCEIMNATKTVRNFCGEVVTELGVGELYVTGVGVMRGYIVGGGHQIDQINASHQGISFGTKDMVRLQPNDDIVFLGRYDKQVKIRGYRVELGEIEATLCQYPQIKSAKVIPKLIGEQEQLVAFILSDLSTKTDFHPDTVRQFMLEHLPYYMVPTQYHLLQQYPLTRNSKLDIAALKMLPNPRNDQYLKETEPENSTEHKLLGFFREVLQDVNISINDNFFAVGGNSFLAAQLTELIEGNTGYCIGMNNVFRHQTVKQMAHYILHSHKVPNICEVQNFHRRTNKKVFNPDNIPLSLQQQQFQFLNETKQRQYYELIFVQKFDASLISLRHLKLAFLRLILRQPSLRTIFPEQDSYVHQEILSGTETYFYSTIQQQVQQSSYFLAESAVLDTEDLTSRKIKILQDEELDLKHEPPILCAIEAAAVNSASYTVILRINHIISDAWSTDLLENDLRNLYREILENEHFAANSNLPFTYADYSIEQFEQKHFLEELASEYADKIVSWITDDPNYNSNILESWERVVGDRMNLSEQINHHHHSHSQTVQHPKFSTAVNFRNFSETGFTFEVGKIEEICGRFEITPFVAFLSAFSLSVHELSGTNQLIINVPTANRSLKTRNIIGNFLNNLLINSTYIPPKKTAAAHVINENSTDSSFIEATLKKEKENTSGNISSERFVKKYIENIKRTVNEIRPFDRVPFIALLKFIRTKLKKLKSTTSTAVLNRLHDTIFFNFRYGLEENHESAVLGKGETQVPPDCIHEIEVEIDSVQDYYSCRIRMKNYVKSQKPIAALCHRMISVLQQMSINSNIRDIAKDEREPSSSSRMIRDLSFGSSTKDEVVEIELRRVWSECLNKEWIRDDDNFFLEGGTSLLTLKLKRLIESKLKIRVELEEIFKYSTFIQLSSLLQRRSNSSRSRSVLDNTVGPTILKNRKYGRKNLQTETTRSETTVRLFHENKSTVDVKRSATIVFFHALVGGVTWTYARMIQQLTRKLPDYFRIIGVEHPDSFSRRYSKDPKFYQSIESLCSKYAQDLHHHLYKMNRRIFIGASFGAILAYQCAVQLQGEGIHIDDIISIDGTAHWRNSLCTTAELSSYEQHCQQINEIVKRQTGGTKIDSELLEAMIENAWELLKMMRVYIPNRSLASPSRLHVTLLKSPSQQILDEDYGWVNLCSTTIVDVPFSHDTMLYECNTDLVVDIIIQTMQKLNEEQP